MKFLKKLPLLTLSVIMLFLFLGTDSMAANTISGSLVLNEDCDPGQIGRSLTYYSFRPTESGVYVFESTGSSIPNTRGWLYDSNWSYMQYDCNSGNNKHFKISEYLEANQTYYLGIQTEGSSVAHTDVYISVKPAPTSGTSGENITWNIDSNGVLTISGQGDMPTYTTEGCYIYTDSNAAYREVYKPEWFVVGKMITEVVIEEGVTSISTGAFHNVNIDMPNCTKITLSDSLTTIKSYAFEGCRGLTDIDGGENLSVIEDRAFTYCSGLKQLPEFPNLTSIGRCAFEYCQGLEGEIVLSGNNLIVDAPFYNCDKITSVRLKEGVKSFDYGSPSDALSKIIIEDQLEELYFCRNLTYIFEGEAPLTVYNNYSSYNNKIYYPRENTTWTEFLSSNSMNASPYGEFSVSSPEKIGYLLSDSSIPDSLYNIATCYAYVETDGADLSYQWQIYDSSNDTWSDMISNDVQTSMLEITPTEESEDTQYRCVVTDYTGKVIISEAMALKKLQIVNEPEFFLYASPGEKVTFTVDAAGADIQYQWQLEDPYKFPHEYTDIEGATEASFTVASNEQLLTRWYRCKMTDNSGNVLCTYACGVRSVNIDTKPKDRVVLSGEMANFYVKASDNDAAYLWQYRESSSNEWKNCTDSGFDTTNLMVQATKAKNNYEYRCCIYEKSTQPESGIYTDLVRLSVYGIKTQPKAQYVKSGNTATFKVSTFGEGLSYQWQYRTSSSGEWKKSTVSSGKTNALKVSATASKNGYEYRCAIKYNDEVVTYTNIVKLNVFGIKSQPKAQIVKAGSTPIFKVTATGKKLTYQWQYRTSANGSWKNATGTGSKTSSFKINAGISKNGYQYRCVIKDNAGNSVNTKAVTLNVLGIKTQPTVQKVKTGKVATFKVTAVGVQLKYQWQYRTSASGTWKNTTATGSKTATLKITSKISNNNYQYRCKITDSKGNVIYTSAKSLYVLGIKTQPKAVSVKAKSTATFKIVATGHEVKYQWQYRTSSSGSWKTLSGADYRKAALKITAIKSKNNYQYRCKITDSKGNVIYSNAAKLTVK